MELFLDVPVQAAPAHALPFRIMLNEMLHRREEELLSHVPIYLLPLPGESPFDALRRTLQDQEDAYRQLEAEQRRIERGARTTPLDDELVLCMALDNKLKGLLHAMQSSALCFSGGGVRSASFSLGVLEGLARFSREGETPGASMMNRLDYLSTVSGGGYSGSWFMSWVWRRFCAAGGADWSGAYGEVVSALAGNVRAVPPDPPMPALTAGDPEPSPLRHLRSYTSFLAPDLGLTLDTFTLFAIVLRNLMVNWLMLLPLLFAAISLVRCSALLMAWASFTFPNLANHSQYLGATLGQLTIGATIALFYGVAGAAALVAMQSHTEEERKSWFSRNAVAIFYWFVLVGSWLLTTWQNKLTGFAWDAFVWKGVIGLVGFGVLGVSTFLRYKDRLKSMQVEQEHRASGNSLAAKRKQTKLYILAKTAALTVLGVVASAAATSALLILLRVTVYALLQTPPGGSQVPSALQTKIFVVLALPLVLGVLLMSTTLFCALLGLLELDQDREWWARNGGRFLQFSTLWIGAHLLVLFGTDIGHHVWTAVAGVAVGLGGSLFGASGLSTAGTRVLNQSQLSKAGQLFSKLNLLLPAVAMVALALIGVSLVAAEDALIGLLHSAFDISVNALSVTLLLGCSLLAILLNLAININLFSLHGMYKMRLMRAFLGASNVLRHPDPFTDFDPDDSPFESELPCAPGVPLHLVNATLNLTGTKKTAWRQRKAESFTWSSLHVGGWRVGYARTEDYAGPNGMRRASSMAISGAAFNPNMGYNSSPLLSLLMSFFNVRLGVWLPNPKWPGLRNYSDAAARRFLSKSGPRFALKPLIEEALGLADDNSPWIEVSDGGHFEDLALYEMVMRRCKHIVVVDAGADPKCFFEDLGNAIRKIRIDLGIPIELDPDLKMHAGVNSDTKYCVTGTINYHCVDPKPAGMSDTEFDGRIVYIKAGMSGREPADILQYNRTHPTFPHETTVNQFFNESQFESYRHLGSYVVQQITDADNGAFLPEMPAPAMDGSIKCFTELAAAYHRKGKVAAPALT